MRLLLGVFSTTLLFASAANDGRARTPPMGWRTWNAFHAAISQDLILNVSLALTNRSRGGVSLADAGYVDLGIDDDWQLCGAYGPSNWTFHDAQGNPVVNTERFPDMKAMVAQIHALNLTAGWYGNNCICADRCNSTECFEGDVKALYNYGYDGYKLDGCSAEKNISLWYNLTHSLGGGATLENCHNGPNSPWGADYADEAGCPFHFYRSSPDITWQYGSVLSNLQSVFKYAAANLTGPGCWAYPDMLMVAHASLNYTESRAHFGAWCIVSAPLTLGFDVTQASIVDSVWDVITNPEAIAVNQAWAGSSGTYFNSSNVTIAVDVKYHVPLYQLLYKPLPGGTTAIFMINNGNNTLPMRVDWGEVPGLQAGATYQVRDIWARADLGAFAGGFSVDVATHDSAFISVKLTG